ncbi:iap-3 [Erannis ankeraria nucleopolyhedrovirus]|uniref:iap-3 n=1 Tax=Erannis ankeraria nucleopolyhedrovirus TaxID=2913600 RepID=UPI00117A93A2|nr:iap-3 [Erannis ankeraria nucleopolyhedrovirus]UJZ89032.1 iap-3 [Erannis ankeraria nucleopolyhedrovirus]
MDINKSANDIFVKNNSLSNNGYIESSPDMMDENERLKTFKNWPVSFLSPIDMAKWGFYYLNKNDEVRCAYCKIQIMKWQSDENPESEHRRYAPQCPLINLDNVVDRKVSFTEPVHPRYSLVNSRLATFKNWPRSLTQTPEELSEAGFYYTGFGDMVKCYYCDGGLKDWERGDIPWEQHAIHFQRCFYLLLIKGQNYVEKIVSELFVIPASPITNNEKEINPIDDCGDTENDYDKDLCIICFSNKRDICYNPCGHVIACAKCVLSLKSKKCFMCKKEYSDVVKCYFN